MGHAGASDLCISAPAAGCRAGVGGLAPGIGRQLLEPVRFHEPTQVSIHGDVIVVVASVGVFHETGWLRLLLGSSRCYTIYLSRSSMGEGVEGRAGLLLLLLRDRWWRRLAGCVQVGVGGEVGEAWLWGVW